jgi:hypothetical protein
MISVNKDQGTGTKEPRPAAAAIGALMKESAREAN